MQGKNKDKQSEITDKHLKPTDFHGKNKDKQLKITDKHLK